VQLLKPFLSSLLLIDTSRFDEVNLSAPNASLFSDMRRSVGLCRASGTFNVQIEAIHIYLRLSKGAESYDHPILHMCKPIYDWILWNVLSTWVEYFPLLLKSDSVFRFTSLIVIPGSNSVNNNSPLFSIHLENAHVHDHFANIIGVKSRKRFCMRVDFTL
jgi:hypothetical protein